ncbi:MAG: hypothetical protein F4Y49_13905, partial [Dehalococcoidia bacterium]|nr:hypothetical protein [Dehalococcoidia bacterium]
MNNNPYQVRGPGTPQMLGREKIFKELCNHLTKLTPSHVHVVGPPRFGKSVLLKHLASYFRDKSDHYVTTLYWNLGLHSPKTDDEFLRRFAAEIKNPLQSVKPELAEYLELKDGGLLDVFKHMKSEGSRFLAVLDGFDYVVEESGITKYLWDEMTKFGEEGSLWLVTGSQRRLSELYSSEDSRMRNFSGIFSDTPLQVGCFESHDWSGFLGPLKFRGITYDDSALKEISNWTGGVPELAAALAQRIFDKFSDITISKSDVDEIAEYLDEERWPLLKDLWNDCPTNLQLDLVTLTRREEVRLPKERHDDLKLRGFARESRKNRLRSSCRLMKRYAQQQEVGASSLQWLFGDEESFKSNIQSLLKLRLTQIRGADPRLMDRVKRAIECLQDDPMESITMARRIEARALELIWDDELGPDRSI